MLFRLTGDASDRRYFRILPRQGESFVLAVNAAPFDYATLPFVNVHDLFAAMPVPVPRILGHADDLGVLALEDLGDVTLQAHVGHRGGGRARGALSPGRWLHRHDPAARPRAREPSVSCRTASRSTSRS